MTDLSPAAQRVLAVATAAGDFCLENVNEIAAAALRAAVVQTQHPGSKHFRGFDNWQCDAAELLAIAEELEGFN